MHLDFLEFEQPIAELQAKIEALRLVDNDTHVNINEEVARLEKKLQELTQRIFESLTPWQVVQLARHPKRPYTQDYIHLLFSEFDELHGDRHFGDDKAIIGGVAKLGEQPVMVIGQQKGRTISEKLFHNFGMPRPEGYRKALRIMKVAERFKCPIVTLIDTAGAYPGIDAEKRGQAEAIARNLYEMALLKTPIISVVIGEGGSGGALAIGVADTVLMLEHSIYSVISPEGCASILWKEASRASDAAEAMKITAQDSLKLGLIDGVIPEPLGGAHRDPNQMADSIKQLLKEKLAHLTRLDQNALLADRYRKWRSYGLEKS